MVDLRVYEEIMSGYKNDFEGADLRDADLSGLNLSNADLSNADLREVDLSGADMRSADLRDANLRSADLRGADLSSANLREAELRGVDLREVDLSNVDLRSANLRETKLLLHKDGRYFNTIQYSSKLDLSGSKLQVSDNIFLNLTDKAISIGEQSEVKLLKNSISYSNIGIAVKDGSIATLIENKFTNNQLDVTTYIKKKMYLMPKVFYADASESVL